MSFTWRKNRDKKEIQSVWVSVHLCSMRDPSTARNQSGTEKARKLLLLSSFIHPDEVWEAEWAPALWQTQGWEIIPRLYWLRGKLSLLHKSRILIVTCACVSWWLLSSWCIQSIPRQLLTNNFKLLFLKLFNWISGFIPKQFHTSWKWNQVSRE